MKKLQNEHMLKTMIRAKYLTRTDKRLKLMTTDLTRLLMGFWTTNGTGKDS